MKCSLTTVYETERRRQSLTLINDAESFSIYGAPKGNEENIIRDSQTY